MSKWSIYQIPTKEEQGIFKQLIGDAFETEALLVSNLETESYTEYIFIYNHPTEEMNNLVSFYGKIKKKKSKELELLEFATAQLTEKMILRNVNDVENLEDFPIEAKVASSIKYDIPVLFNEDEDLSTSAVTEDYSSRSQATYFFECDVNTPSSIGSFCCILQKGTEYFILTAEHNLKNQKGDGTKIKDINGKLVDKDTTSKLYRLKNGDIKVNLELREYSKVNDYAILKISDNKRISSTILATVDTDFVQKVVKDPKEEEAPKDGNLVAYQYCNKPIKGLKYINRGNDGKFAISDGERGKSGGAIVYNDRVMGMYQNVSDGEKQAITLKYILDDVNEGKTDKYKPA